jgi:hypothetical protein
MPRYKVVGGSGSALEANLRPVGVGLGLPEVEDLHLELQDMLDVLLDRVKLPIDYNNSMALMEIADVYYTRAQEIKFRIHALEREGKVRNGRGSKDPYYTFRTGELEDFLEAAKRSIETGSRRLSALQYEFEKSLRGLQGWGG